MWLLAALLWCGAIFIATSSASATGGNTQSIIEQYLGISASTAAALNVVFRKFVHLGAFGFLAILFYNSFEQRKFMYAWALTTLYAASDEFHQLFIPNRTGSILDVGIDSIGALIALLIIAYGRSIIPNKKGCFQRGQ